MRSILKHPGRFIVLVGICQLVMTFCTPRLHPEQSFPAISNKADKHLLMEFMEGGTGKMPVTGNTRPGDIIKTAEQYLGVPHCMGGTTMKCMDCSGLLVTVFGAHDIHLPHNSEEQARYGKIIAAKDELRKGDMVFFVRSYKTNQFITHSGIYIGNGQFIHTSSSRGVTITSLSNPWWEEKFIFGTRIFP